MLDSIGTDDGLRALLVVGSNVAVASPDARQVTDRLARLDCLAVLDAFANHTTDLAHMVLPVTQWAEEDGTTTNLEGRVIRRRRATRAPADVRSDIEVLCALAARLGHAERFTFDGPEQVFAELGRASSGGRADYSGITYARLDDAPGCSGPAPRPAIPAPPACSPNASATPTAGPASSPSTIGRRRRNPTTSTRSGSPPAGTVSTTTPAARPVG